MSIITLTSIDAPVKKDKYFYIAIEYNDKGKDFKKKVMDFQNKEVYKVIKAASVGEQYEVKIKKDNNGYWQWDSLTKVEATSNKAASGGGVVSSSTVRSNYETPEERAKRQVYIARQSSLTAAFKFMELNEIKPETPDFVMSLAETFTDWVMRDVNNEENVDGE